MCTVRHTNVHTSLCQKYMYNLIKGQYQWLYLYILHTIFVFVYAKINRRRDAACRRSLWWLCIHLSLCKTSIYVHKTTIGVYTEYKRRHITTSRGAFVDWRPPEYIVCCKYSGGKLLVRVYSYFSPTKSFQYTFTNIQFTSWL